MKKMRFRFFLIIGAIFLVLLFANQGMCGLVLAEGESYTFEFDTLPYDSEYNEDFFIYALIRASTPLSVPPQFIFSVYEDSFDQPPIKSSLSSIDPDSVLESLFYFTEPELSPFQDLQGLIYLEVIKGTIDLEEISASAIIDSKRYNLTATVPIPSSSIITLSGFFLIVFVRRIKNSI